MGTNDITIPLSKMRRIISERMCSSLNQTAQFTLTREICVDTLLDFIALHKNDGQKVKLMHFLIKVVAEILQERKILNASITENGLIYHGDVNIGVAVALPEGLLVPVLKSVDKKSILEIKNEYEVLIQKAKTGKLPYNDMSEGTFTVSNLGMAGIDAFTPIVNHPEAAVLGVGRAAERVILDEKNVPKRSKTIVFSLTVDHRIVDGFAGALFLQDLAEILTDTGKLESVWNNLW